MVNSLFLSYKRLMFIYTINMNNGRKTVTITSDIKNREYFTHDE